jgi:hypothetical protein
MLSLDIERQTYESALPDLLKCGEGQYVVIRGEEVCKVLPTYEEALTWGYESFGLSGFLVKKVSAVETSAYMSRFAGSCAD